MQSVSEQPGGLDRRSLIPASVERGLSALGRFTPDALRIRYGILAVLAILAVAPNCNKGEPDDNCIFDIKSASVSRTVTKGGLEFGLYKTDEVAVNDSYGRTLSHFIQGTLTDSGYLKNLDSVGRRAYIDAFIELCGSLNSSVDLDNFASVNGQNIIFPSVVAVRPIAGSTGFTEVVTKQKGGYSVLQTLAEKDGFPVRNLSEQDETYNASLKRGVKIPDSPYYYREKGSDDSPAVTDADVVQKLQALGKDFYEHEFIYKGVASAGWKFAYGDVLRNPTVNASRNGSMPGTTHTARSLDLSGNARVIGPDGKEHTWSDFSGKKPKRGPDAAFLDEQIRPVLEELAMKHGFVVYWEFTHDHVYAPKSQSETSWNNAIVINLCVTEKEEVRSGGCGGDEGQKVVEKPPTSPSENPDRVVARAEFNGKMGKAVSVVIAKFEGKKDPNALEKLEELRAFVVGAFEGNEDILHSKKGDEVTSVDWHEILQFPRPSDDLTKEYGGKSYEQLQKMLNDADKDDDVEGILAVRDYKIQRRVIEILHTMDYEQIGQSNIFKGSVVHGAVSFNDVEAAWRYKLEHKSGSDVKKYGHYVEVEGMNNAVSMSEWYKMQTQASAYFQQHGEDLGFAKELMDYMSPALVLAVLHGEFFSELSGEVYLDTVSAVFAPYNILRGPAVGDKEFSSGPVQMTWPALKTILDQNNYKLVDKDRNVIKEGNRLVDMQLADASYRIVVPQEREYSETRTVRVGKRNKKVSKKVTDTWIEYDRKAVADAMVNDPQSIIFYAYYCIASHIEPGFLLAREDKNFNRAWDSATEAQRFRFLASFGAMAINAGPSGARSIMEVLLRNVNSSDLDAYTEGIPDAAHGFYSAKKGRAKKADTTHRNAERGQQTADWLLVNLVVTE